MQKLIRFIKDCYLELKKVTWPSREEVLSSPRVVIINIIAIAIILDLIDIVLFNGITFVFSNLRF